MLGRAEKVELMWAAPHGEEPMAMQRDVNAEKRRSSAEKNDRV